MINEIFSILINDHLSPYLISKIGSPNDSSWVYPCNISEINTGSTDATKGKIIMSLVNIEEDRVYQINDTRLRTGSSPNLSFQKPPVYLNLYLLFASNFENDSKGKKYLDGLNVISYVIQFFQHQNVFTQQNSPNLVSSHIEELVFDLKTLSFQDLNNLWGVLGAKYLPSVLYKVRLLAINEDFSLGTVPFIQNISVTENTLQ